MSGFSGQVALVTGGGGGVGGAVASALAQQGARVCVAGRNAARLADVAGTTGSIVPFAADLRNDDTVDALVRHLEKTCGRLDFLIHSAGSIHLSPMEQARVDDLDSQYAVNLRAPYLLTQRLLPMLVAAAGQIVFVNSSLGLRAARPEVGQYAATKHGIRAIADSLREELNSKGVRVLSVFLGRTATPMQQEVCRSEGRPYRPEFLIQPADVASLLVSTLALPNTVEVTEMTLRPARRMGDG